MKKNIIFYGFYKKIYYLKLSLFLGLIFLIKKRNILYNLDLDKENDANSNNYKNRYDFILQNLPLYNHTHIYNNTIYWCWLQEKIDKPILNACLNSVIRNNKGNKIVIINKNNIHQYVHFPLYILNKFNNNTISKTHFSDLLRLELLLKYGGTWIDSTVLMTKYNKDFFGKDLFLFQSFGRRPKTFSNWFLTSEKDSPILKTTLDLLYEYWRTNNKLNDYFLLHYFLKISFNIYNKDLNKIVKFSRDNAHLMQNYLFKSFNNIIFNQIINKTSIHKLTYKFKNNIEKGLFYHHILKLYG